MIFRLSQKLNAKIKAGTLRTLPLNENPFADWSAHLFVAGRTQYILLSNTMSLFSTVMHGKGITNEKTFIERALSSLRLAFRTFYQRISPGFAGFFCTSRLSPSSRTNR